MNRKIVLASASPRRKELLEKVGLSPSQVVPSGIDENIDEENPENLVQKLSAMKAKDVAKQFSADEIIIAADTIVVCEGNVLGKPSSREDARQMLRLMAGRSHDVYTGVTLVLKQGEEEKRKTFFEKTEVVLYPMADEEIEAYVATGESDDKAGAYGIQGYFARFIKGMVGDYYNVVGLPVGRVYQELKDRM